jgi:hypothetical protein
MTLVSPLRILFAMILDVRIYKIHAGKRDEFHALVRDETIPMASRYGQSVVDFGPSEHDDDSYYLIRAFPSLEVRTEALARFYESDEWRSKYDARVMAFIESYQTAVISSPDAVGHILASEGHRPDRPRVG